MLLVVIMFPFPLCAMSVLLLIVIVPVKGFVLELVFAIEPLCLCFTNLVCSACKI